MNKLSIILKSDLSDKIKQAIYQAVAVLVLLYWCTIWTLKKRMEKKSAWEQHKKAANCFEQIQEATFIYFVLK